LAPVLAPAPEVRQFFEDITAAPELNFSNDLDTPLVLNGAQAAGARA
jgi:hypothetical protein